MKISILNIIKSIIFTCAIQGASNLSQIGMYEPRIPKELKK